MPKWIKPQLTRLVDEAPAGGGWVHEIKYDGYRMHARSTATTCQAAHPHGSGLVASIQADDRGAWLPEQSRPISTASCAPSMREGVPVFSRLQAAMDEGRTDQLVFFAFDLLFLNGESTTQLPLIQRKERLQRLFRKEISGLRYSEHVAGDGPSFRAQACKLGLEGAISKQADRPYNPGDRGIWVKSSV